MRQRVQEMSVALIKVSVGVRRMEFRHRLEKLCFDIVENAAISNFEILLKNIETIDSLIRFGKIIYEVEPVTAETILQECSEVRSLIKQYSGIDFESDIAEIMALQRTIIPENKKKRQSKKEEGELEKKNEVSGNSIENTAIQKENTAIALIENGTKENEDSSNNAAMRQSAIVDKIRQMNGKQVQLKDIIAEFEEVSERTIRYDLQKLCSQGLLERVGPGGPTTYYRIRVL